MKHKYKFYKVDSEDTETYISTMTLTSAEALEKMEEYQKKYPEYSIEVMLAE